MRPEEQDELDAIMDILRPTFEQVCHGHDCRLVLGTMLGAASSLAGSMRQAGVLTAVQVANYFNAALEGAYVDKEKAPEVHTRMGGNGVKQ